MTAFFLIPCDLKKRPLTKNGEHDATVDAHYLRHRYPDCNLAVATGPSELIALDEDCYKEIYVEGSVEKACGLPELPKTVEWRSGRGGRVRIFKRPAGLVVPAKNGVLPAVDVKASTGYVLCPPSRNAEGQPYTWVNPPSTTPVADAPPGMLEWLARAKAQPPPLPTRTDGGREEVYLTAGTGRWEAVRRLGGLLRRKGVGEAALNEMLRSFIDHHCEPDESLRDSEVQRLCSWLATNPPSDPFGADVLRDEPEEEAAETSSYEIVREGFGEYRRKKKV